MSYFELMRGDVRETYYEMMKQGNFKFIAEKINGENGYCISQTDPVFRMKYHFKKVDGTWKMDMLKTSKAANDFLRDVLGVFSGNMDPYEEMKTDS